VLSEEKLDEIDARLENSLKNLSGTFQRTQRLTVLGFRFQIFSISEKKLQHENENILWRDHFQHLL
jgi:hypothetical protein